MERLTERIEEHFITRQDRVNGKIIGNQINQSQQYNLNGDCSLCRRKNYCSKPCTKNKRKTEIMIRSVAVSKLNEMTGGAYLKTLEIINSEERKQKLKDKQ